MDGRNKMTPTNPEETKPTKVIKGEVKEVKKGVGKKISEFFFEEDGKTVWRWVLDTCIKPGLIDLVYDIGVNTLRGRLYGTGTRRRESSGSSFERNDYEGRFKSSRDRETRNKPKRRGAGGFDLMEIFDDHGDAEAVLDAMKERIDKFDCVTVGDYYDFLGKSAPGNYMTADYGWEDLDGVSVRHSRDGFYIDLPKPTHLG